MPGQLLHGSGAKVGRITLLRDIGHTGTYLARVGQGDLHRLAPVTVLLPVIQVVKNRRLHQIGNTSANRPRCRHQRNDPAGRFRGTAVIV